MLQSSSGTSVSTNNPGGNTNTAAAANNSKSQRRLSLCSQIATHSSPIVFPEKQKRSKKLKAASSNSKRSTEVIADDPFPFDNSKIHEHRIDIGAAAAGDENSDLLGGVVFSGKLILDKGNTSSSASYNNTSTKEQTFADVTNQQAVDARLTSKALVWGSHMLHLDHVISVISSFHSKISFNLMIYHWNDCRYLSHRYHTMLVSDILQCILIP